MKGTWGQAPVPSPKGKFAHSRKLFQLLCKLIKLMYFSGRNTCLYEACASLKTVIFENNPRMTIYRSAFANCKALESVTLPDSLTRMDNTFDGCTSLKELVIPTNTTGFSGTIVVPDCVLYVSNLQAEFYAQQYGYEYVYLTNE